MLEGLNRFPPLRGGERGQCSQCSVLFTCSKKGSGWLPALHPIRARLHQWGWGGKAAPALAEPHLRQGLSCEMGSNLPHSPYQGQQGPRHPYGNPSPGLQPAGSGTASPAPPSPSPPCWLARTGAAGRRAVSWQSCPLAGPGWPEGPSPEPDPDSRSSPASSRRRQPHAMDSESVATAGAQMLARIWPRGRTPARARQGLEKVAVQRKPVVHQRAKRRVPTRLTPQGLRPLLSLPFPFILCICTYMV